MTRELQLAGGSWIGRDHRIAGRNNQDSWIISQDENLAICIVADGCGSGKRSEVGSQIGVQLLARAIRTAHTESATHTINWHEVQQHVLSHIDILARAMSVPYRTVIEDFFLFTVVGAVIDQQQAVFFTLGDGTIVVNENDVELRAYPDNAPPYLGYCLIQERVNVDPALLQLQAVHTIDTKNLDTFLLATDGIDDFIAREQTPLPGMPDVVGPVTQFTQEDRYFVNPELISRRLKLVSRDWPIDTPQPGLLHDDTTLIVGRYRDTQTNGEA